MCYPNVCPTMSWLRRSSFVLAITTVGGIGSGAAFLSACGSADAGLEFGVPTNDDAGDAGSTGEVIVPPGDEGADGGVIPDAPTQAKCVASSADLGTVCVHVKKAVDGPAPDSTHGIDGSGALVVMLMPDPWVKTSTPVVVKMFPSPSSGKDSFDVMLDLPKTADIDVKPGKYLPFAVFYDQPGFTTRQIDAGDYVPKMATDWIIPRIDIAAGGAIDVEVDLYPLRSIDVTVSLGTSVHPLGSGTGPLVAGLVGPGSASSANIVGIAQVACADVQYGKPALHLLTTAPATSTLAATDPASEGYGLRVGLFDFASGPDDVSVDPSIVPPAPGAIVNYDATRAPKLKVQDGWVGAPVEAVLDHVVPFVDAVPTDPTPSCTSYGAAPK